MSGSFLASLVGRKRVTKARTNRVLRLESLENRVVMSATPLLVAPADRMGPMPQPASAQIAVAVPMKSVENDANLVSASPAVAGDVTNPAFQVRYLAAPQSSKPLVDGGMTHGKIQDRGQVDTYTFTTKTANEIVEIAFSRCIAREYS